MIGLARCNLIIVIAAFACIAFAVAFSNAPTRSSNGSIKHREISPLFMAAKPDRHSTYQTLFTSYDPHNRRSSGSETNETTRRGEILRFTYDFDELVVGNDTSSETTTAVMLLHPIGVGIGNWYYDRLTESLNERYGGIDRRFVFLSPDLLGSASASAPIGESGNELMKLPLLNISDWSEQVEELMADYEAKSEAKGYFIKNWSIVANGGCSPIALKVAQHAANVEGKAPFKGEVTNVIISAPPRLPFFLRGNDPAKVHKSYRTLSGLVGDIFWWYALWRKGKFIQKFSEANLCGKPENLGEDWTPNCVATAKLFGGRSRYSTFAFLAGALQDGCRESLEALQGSGVKVDFIRGLDKRRNRARSWFWQRQKRRKNVTDSGNGTHVVSAHPKEKHAKEKHENALEQQHQGEDDESTKDETIQQYVKMNGNRGETIYIGGRISLAHEDANGYADALMKLTCV